MVSVDFGSKWAENLGQTNWLSQQEKNMKYLTNQPNLPTGLPTCKEMASKNQSMGILCPAENSPRDHQGSQTR